MAANLADVMAEIHRGRRRERGVGSKKWCKKCSRFHGRYAVCDLYLRTSETRAGAPRKVWAH